MAPLGAGHLSEIKIKGRIQPDSALTPSTATRMLGDPCACTRMPARQRRGQALGQSHVSLEQ